MNGVNYSFDYNVLGYATSASVLDGDNILVVGAKNVTIISQSYY